MDIMTILNETINSRELAGKGKNAYAVYITEMAKLAALLTEACIPFENDVLFDTSQIIYPSKQNRVCDVICHEYSYGYEKGLLEIMGLTDNEGGVEGYLTAEEVFDKINKHYKN